MKIPVFFPNDEPVVLLDSAAEVDALVVETMRRYELGLRLVDAPVVAAEPAPAVPAQTLRSGPADAITPQIIRDLIAFGRTQVENGAATQALTAIEANNANLVAAYRLGWLPPTITSALSRNQRQALRCQRLGNSIIIPAFDDQNIAVDLVIVNPKGGVRLSLFDEPRGLIAPEVLHIADELIVTDTFTWVARLFSAGHRNVLLLRGTVDAAANVGRIAAAGVRQVVVRTYRSGDAIAEAVRAAGITVTMDRRRVETEAAPIPTMVAPVRAPIAAPAAPIAPTPAAPVADPNGLVFVEEEGKDIAIFQAGAVRYSVTMRADGVTKRRVVSASVRPMARSSPPWPISRLRSTARRGSWARSRRASARPPAECWPPWSSTRSPPSPWRTSAPSCLTGAGHPSMPLSTISPTLGTSSLGQKAPVGAGNCGNTG